MYVYAKCVYVCVSSREKRSSSQIPIRRNSEQIYMPLVSGLFFYYLFIQDFFQQGGSIQIYQHLLCKEALHNIQSLT